MATVLRDKRIKSADRVLEIFEMFDAERQSVTVMEVARALNVPQSSTSELLGTLVRLGYLSRDRSARVFRPTARIALLGAWVHPTLFRNGRLLPMMDDLSDVTGEATALCSMVGVGLAHVHVVSGGDPIPHEIGVGARRHLLHSPFGLALISTIFSEHVRKMVHRLNAESVPEQQVRYAELAVELERIRKQGYAMREVQDGWTGIAVLLPQGLGEEQLSVGVIGRTEIIEERCEELVRNLRGAISQHLGPRIARNSARPQPSYAMESRAAC